MSTNDAERDLDDVLDLADVLEKEEKPVDRAWCPGSRRILRVDDDNGVTCPRCGMEWHGIGSTRAGLPHHLPWNYVSAEAEEVPHGT